MFSTFIESALIDIDARHSRLIQFEAFLASTDVRAKSVLAKSASTNACRNSGEKAVRSGSHADNDVLSQNFRQEMRFEEEYKGHHASGQVTTFCCLFR